ncbi:MAG: SpoIIE family protein phosphatase [Treponema sp.]|nr:SpoIIE family protein phosphatase [Treponema sp.]
MKKAFIILTAVFSVLFSSCSKEGSRIELTDGWTYSTTEPEDSNFLPLNKKELQNLSALLPENKGFIWIKNVFSIPQELQNKKLCCFLGKITLADQTRINGVLIGETGNFPPETFSAWNITRNYYIPNEILKAEGNTLLIKIWCDGEGSLLLNPYIGLKEDVSFFSGIENFLNCRLYLLFAFSSLIAGLCYLIMFFKRKTEKENFTFAAVSIITAIYFSVFYIHEIPGLPLPWMHFIWFQKIFTTGLPFVIAFIVTSFIYHFIKVKEYKAFFITRILLTAAPLVIIMLTKDCQELYKKLLLTSLFMIPLLFYMLFVVLFNYPKHKKLSSALLISFLPVIAAAVYDIIKHAYLHQADAMFLTGAGWMTTLLILLFAMAYRSAKNKNDAEYLKHNFEKEVSSRTHDLTKTNRELELAFQQAQQDLLLAKNAQQSLFSSNLSGIEGWDIAVHFKPAGDVSGDLYDIFTKDGVLKGAGLFDVTGKGISAGLVTILSKSIIDRKFNEGALENLGKTMSMISSSIAKEKGNVENYLTGTLLRINKNRVEYVNAGQPKAFFRKASGQVAAIQSASQNTDEEAKLGLSILPPEFKTIAFTMQSGDCILLYTHSLQDAKNSFGISFGSERVSRALASSGDGTAQEKMNVLLDIFNLYTTDVPLDDDLTIMLIQKK